MKLLLSVFLFTITWPISAQQGKIDSFAKRIEIIKDDSLKVNQLLELSAIYSNNSKLDSALFAANLGLELAKSIGDKKLVVKCEQAIGWTSWNLGDYATSIKFGYSELDYAKSTNDTAFWIDASALLSNSYRDQGDFNEALPIVRDLMPIVTAQKCEKCGVFNAAIGAIYFGLEKYDSALYYIEKGLSYPKDFAYGWMLMMAGKTMAKLNNVEMAFEYLHKSVQPLIDRPNLKDLTSAYAKLADLYSRMEQYDSAIYYGTKSVDIGKEYSFNKELLEGYLSLSKATENVDKGQALAYYKLAMDLKNNIYNQDKQKQIISYKFNEILKQNEIEATQLDAKNRLKLNALLGSTFTFVVIVILLFRYSRMKQKSEQKIETAYHQLKSTQSQLIQSEKMASLGELTAGIAHEIQNPLNFVNNFSDVSSELLDEAKGELKNGDIKEVEEIIDSLKENLSKINHHGQRASSIVKGMLDHSRTSAGEKTPTDINALCDEYVRLAYHGARAKDKSFNVNYETDFQDNIPSINIVPQDIGRVILNLVNNAFQALQSVALAKDTANAKAEEYHPIITIKTELVDGLTGLDRSGAEGEIGVGSEPSVLITIADNGPGIPEKIKDKIFQPFFTTKPAGQGTGLGLSLSYDIVKAHDGALRVRDNKNSGSIFSIEIPMR